VLRLSFCGRIRAVRSWAQNAGRVLTADKGGGEFGLVPCGWASTTSPVLSD
jgi:hypothetical protein